MTRKLYTVSKWDKEAGKGYATDGTSWEGDPILFSIFGMNIPDYGYLDPGETITAVERIGDYPECERWLTDVIVESGPRAFRPAPVDSCSAPVFDPNPPAKPNYEGSLFKAITVDMYEELVERVSALEDRVYGDDDSQ